MLQSEKGFTLIESLVAFTIVMIVALTIAPLYYKLHVERESLYNKRIISEHLHDILQEFIYDNHSIPYENSLKINKETVAIDVKQDENYIQICGSWTSLDKEDVVCLYARPIE